MIISGNCCLLWSPALVLCLGALFGAPPAAAASQHRVLQHCHQRMPLAASLADDPRKSNGASGWVQIGCWQISQDDTGGTQMKQLQQEWLSEWGNHQQELKNELVEKYMQHMAFIKKMDDERNTVHQPSKGNMGNSPKMGPIPLHGTKMALSGYRECGPLQCCCQCLWWLGKQLALVHRRTEESLEHQHHLWPLGEKMGLRTNSDLSPRLMCVEIVFLIC